MELSVLGTVKWMLLLWIFQKAAVDLGESKGWWAGVAFYSVFVEVIETVLETDTV